MILDSLTHDVVPEDWNQYKWELVEEERAKNRMMKVLPYIPKKGKHLDIGIGRGEGTYEVSLIKQTFGLDYGSKTLKLAKKFQLDLIQADGRYLPFKNKCFTSITALDVIEHIPNPHLLLADVYRVLTDDGIFIIQTPVAETEAVKTKAKKIYKKFKTINKIDKICNKIRYKLNRIAYDGPAPATGSQPYDIVLQNQTLLQLLEYANFQICRRKKVNYFVSSFFIQLFSYSDQFILKKRGRR